MQEQLKCDFELSKSLKKLGFDIEVHESYVNVDLLETDYEKLNENDYHTTYYINPQNHNSKKHRISRPLACEAKIWLFKNHGLYLNVKPILVEDGVKWVFNNYLIDDFKISKDVYLNKEFNSHDECVLYGLKSIIKHVNKLQYEEI